MKPTKPYKIAVVIPKYGLVGGAEGFAAELTERFAQRDTYEMHVFANTWQVSSPSVHFHKIPIITFPKFLTTVSFAWFVQKALETTPCDLIHSHDRIFSADLYTMHGIPHRIWIDDVRRKKTPSLFDRATIAVEKKMVEGGCRRFLAVSGLTKEIFLREYPMAPEKVPIIHPGITIRETTAVQAERDREEVRRHYGIGPADIVILFVSMNFDIKGLDAVLAGLGRFVEGNPQAPVKLLIAGKGNESHYKRLSQKLGIAERLIFTGIVDRGALEKIYAAGDLYAMLSKFDTFGLVILEAMAASLPVLISANVGAKDLVEEGETGFVITDPTDTDAIANRLAILLDERQRTIMAKAAFQTAQKCTWEETVKKVEALYKELLHEKHP
ncbi:MAG: N-acetyl-alpha-D-glucosaminyl L-malate synthase [Syntrophus sp. SKADARSKE-3]|nr:N-acetyl-alpha-D-glucosaminyl L-malate synthase [Syntrophus sp. SKADARSKE-3]